MSVPSFSVKRHVMTYMLSLVLILFGIISYNRIGVDRLPQIDFPMLSVSTVLPGADPTIIDASVTNIIESAVNSVSGIDSVNSQSLPGISVVMIKFELSRDINAAFNEVQAKINEVLRQLPTDAETPIVKKVELGGQPIMWLALHGDRTLQQLNLYAKNTIKKRIETVSGVGNILIAGERERTIRVDLDLDQMTGLGVSVNDVINAFRREHIKLPGGFIDSGDMEQQLKLDVEYHDLDGLKTLIVSYGNNLSIHLSDIAEVYDGLADFRRFASYNSIPTVGLGVVKISGTNTVAIIDEVKKRLNAEILPQLPSGMYLDIVVDDADRILQIVKGLQEHLIEGTLLAALVVFLFLKNLRSTLIVATAIPVSLLGAIAAIYFAGFTFNTMTLLGLLLLIGVVVDDAIVVLENIFRIMEKDPQHDPIKTSVVGTNEVMFSILAATLTLVSLFGAVVFMDGIMGRFLGAFAIVVVFGVLISLFVSVTLTPTLCARYLRVTEQHGKLYQSLEKFFVAMENSYKKAIHYTLDRRGRVLLIAALVVYSSGWFMGQLGKGFMPDEDQARFIVSIKTPLGSSIEYTRNRLQLTEKILSQHPEISGLFSTIGTGDLGQVNKGEIFVTLVPRSERNIHQVDFIQIVRKDLAKIPGVNAFAAPVPVVGGQRGEPLQFVLKGPELKKVAQLSKTLEERLRKIPVIGPLDTNLQLDMPEIRLLPKREQAMSVGIDTFTLTNALRVVAGGLDVAKFNNEPGDGFRYKIRLKAKAGTFEKDSDLNRIYLRNKMGEMVRMDTVAEFKSVLGPATIGKYNLQYSATFYSTPRIPEGDASVIVLNEAKKILPVGYQVELIGRAKEFSKTVGYIIFAFITGLTLVYMTLASQFNSFIQPLIVMVAQPLAIIGGIVGLWLFGHTLNIFSMIGLVLLMGLVAKNSILLIDLTNELRKEGKSIKDALLIACPQRMRPILMTSLTVILSLFPAAMGLGAGSDTNGPMAVAVIGGMISSTLLTLIVVPAVYSLIENGLERKGERSMFVVLFKALRSLIVYMKTLAERFKK